MKAEDKLAVIKVNPCVAIRAEIVLSPHLFNVLNKFATDLFSTLNIIYMNLFCTLNKLLKICKRIVLSNDGKFN